MDKELSSKKAISQLKPSMYVVSLDQSWFQTPFYQKSSIALPER
jgi:hypothetical protein